MIFGEQTRKTISKERKKERFFFVQKNLNANLPRVLKRCVAYHKRKKQCGLRIKRANDENYVILFIETFIFLNCLLDGFRSSLWAHSCV